MRFLILTLSALAGVAAAQHPITEYVDIESKFLFAPVGFDSNDEIMVVLDGYLPNTCYRLTQPEIVGLETKNISIQPLAYIAAGNCLPFAVPFTQEVRLARLDAGNYTVTTNKGRITEPLSVAVAKPLTGIDDFNYAPVESVEIVHEMETGTTGHHTAILKGRFTNTCLQISRVDAFSSNGKTTQVLPKMVQLAEGPEGEPCQNKEVLFTVSRRLPALSLGRHLVHVRTSGGQAINRVFTNLIQP